MGAEQDSEGCGLSMKPSSSGDGRVMQQVVRGGDGKRELKIEPRSKTQNIQAIIFALSGQA
jgi:hypothetical protein